MATQLIDGIGSFSVNLALFSAAALVFLRELSCNRELNTAARTLWSLAFLLPGFPGFVAYRLAWRDRPGVGSFGFSVFTAAELVTSVFVGIVLTCVALGPV